MKINLALCHLLSMAWAINLRNGTFNRDLVSDGGTCDPSKRLLSVEHQSLLSCCAICKSESACESVCFNQHNKTCVLCKGTESSSEQEDPNMTHYYLVSNEQDSSTVKSNMVTDSEFSMLSVSVMSSSSPTTAAYTWVDFKKWSYAYINKAVNWENAETFCKSFGNDSKLVGLNTAAKVEFIQSTFLLDKGNQPVWVKGTVQDENSNVYKGGEIDENGQMVCVTLYQTFPDRTRCFEKYTFICQRPTSTG